METAASLATERPSPWLTFAPSSREWGLIVCYALAFWATHRIAILWGGEGFYSLWFPAAGVRLALLWRMGARLTPAVALAEVAVQLATGDIMSTDPDWPQRVIDVVRPTIAYGLTVAAVQWATGRTSTSFATAPMPFGLTSVLAPIAAALFALPGSLLHPDLTNVANVRDVIASLSGFAVGDMLGVLLVAPPLLWIVDFATTRSIGELKPPRLIHVAEAVIVLGIALTMVVLLASLDLGAPSAKSCLGCCATVTHKVQR